MATRLAEAGAAPREALRDPAAPDRSTDDPAEMHDPSRGRQARTPEQIPARGWKDSLLRTRKEFAEDQSPVVSAGVTFYVLLAMFPALGSFVALYGLFANVTEVRGHLQVLSAVLPAETLTFVAGEMVRVSLAHEASLSVAFLGGLLLSIWSANGATRAMITAMNIAYDEVEKRGFFRRTLISLAFTLGFLAFGIVALAAIAAPPAIERFFGPSAATMFRLSMWPGLLVAVGLGLAVL
jgi:membrane protein